jgi:hypothetical protein
MNFETPNELVAYLIDVEDDPTRRDNLRVGQNLRRLAEAEGHVEPDERSGAGFARLLFMAKDDGWIGFVEHEGYERPLSGFLGLTPWHADNVTDIRVTSGGRNAVESSAIHALLRSLSSDATAFLDALDARIDEVPVPPEQKTEARAALRTAREITTSTAGSVLGAALSAHLKMLGL